MPREVKYVDCNYIALRAVRKDEQAEKNGFFLEQLHVMAEIGGGSEGVSKVTFEGKEWAFNKEIHPLCSKPGFPDLSTFESGAGLPFAGVCLVHCRVFGGP